MHSMLCKYRGVHFLLFYDLSLLHIFTLIYYQWHGNGIRFCLVQESSGSLSSGPRADFTSFWKPIPYWSTIRHDPKGGFFCDIFQHSVFIVTLRNIVCVLYPEPYFILFGSSALTCSPKLGLWNTSLMLSRVLGWENEIFGPRPQCLSLCLMKWILKILHLGNNLFFLFAYFCTGRRIERTSLKRNWNFSLFCRAVNHNILWEKQSLNLWTLFGEESHNL